MREQWIAWMGWTLVSFEFTVFLLMTVRISKEFNVTEVAAVFAITPSLRLLGVTASRWLADSAELEIPLVISLLWYSICNFNSPFSPTSAFLFSFRVLLGIGSEAELARWSIARDGFVHYALAWADDVDSSWLLGFRVPLV